MTIPANKLVEFALAKTPERRLRIVKQLRKATTGRPCFYQLFHKPAREFLYTGASDVRLLHDQIALLQTRKSTEWKTVDSRITTEALRNLEALGPNIQRTGFGFEPCKTSKAILHLPEADVSVRPNAIVTRQGKGGSSIGGLRFYLAKESRYQIGQRGAELIATLSCLWLEQSKYDGRPVDPAQSLVVEVMQRRVTAAPADHAFHVELLRKGASDLVRLWQQLDAEEAA